MSRTIAIAHLNSDEHLELARRLINDVLGKGELQETDLGETRSRLIREHQEIGAHAIILAVDEIVRDRLTHFQEV